MEAQNSITVVLGTNYPIFKKVGNELVRLEKQEPGKRYSLTANIQTKETYYLQYTDEEEAKADKEKEAWEAGAVEREAEAIRQQQEAQRFEESLKYDTKIVAFIDILGWGKEVSKDQNDGDAIKALGKTLATLRLLTEQFNGFGKLLTDTKYHGHGGPVMTQFSDSILLSVNDDGIGKVNLQHVLSILSSSLAHFGFLIRGGVVKGQIYHTDSLVFGPALKEAYDLESQKAIGPRVILSKELGEIWKDQEELDGGVAWAHSPDGYYFFNFLPPFLGNPFFFSDQKLWEDHLNTFRSLIIKKAKDRLCPEDVFAKYEWLAGYFDSVCALYPPAKGLEVTQEMKALRWGP